MQNRRQLKKELPRVDEEVRKRSRRQSGELSPVDGMERFVRVLRTGDPGGQPGGREHGAGAGCVWGALTACRSMCESLSQDTVKDSGVIFLAVKEVVWHHSVGVMQSPPCPSARTNYFRVGGARQRRHRPGGGGHQRDMASAQRGQRRHSPGGNIKSARTDIQRRGGGGKSHKGGSGCGRYHLIVF